MNDDALKILKKVETGALSVEEGAQLLQELENHAQAADRFASPTTDPSPTFIPQTLDGSPPEVEEALPDLGWWKKGWLFPFWIGTGILVFGALQMGWAYSSKNFFWLNCAWLPMAFGLLVLFLSWWSQQARWVHVRVQDADGSRVSISLPLPLGLAGWGLRTFGRFIPNTKADLIANLPGIFDALAKNRALRRLR